MADDTDGDDSISSDLQAIPMIHRHCGQARAVSRHSVDNGIAHTGMALLIVVDSTPNSLILKRIDCLVSSGVAL